MKESLDPYDKILIRTIREGFLIAPNNRSYNMRNDFKAIDDHNAVYPSWMVIRDIMDKLYPKGSKPGYFVEAGALDGEYLTNTLNLEVDKGWKGLLVEPDKDNYELLKKTNRKAWITTSCFSTHAYPESVVLKRIREAVGSPDWLMRATSAIMDVSYLCKCSVWVSFNAILLLLLWSRSTGVY